MSILDLERMTEISDLDVPCPQKSAELDLMTPVTPDGVSEDLGPGSLPEPRWWRYRVC